MRKIVKRIIAVLLMSALLLELLPMYNREKEVQAESLPFTIEDTTEGVADAKVLAKKLQLTDSDAEIIDVGFSDLLFVMKSITDDEKKIYVVGMTGLLHTFEVKQSDMGNHNNSWRNEIRGWFKRLNSDSYFLSEDRDAIYIVKNPETKLIDLVNITTGKYYEYGFGDESGETEVEFNCIQGKQHKREDGLIYYDALAISVFHNKYGSIHDGTYAYRDQTILDTHGEILLQESMACNIVFNEKNRMLICSQNLEDVNNASHTLYTFYLFDKEEGIILKTDKIKVQDIIAFGKKNVLIQSFDTVMEDSFYIDIESAECKPLGFADRENHRTLDFEGASDLGIYALYRDLGDEPYAFYDFYFISPDGKKTKLKYDSLECVSGKDSLVFSTKGSQNQKTLYVVQGGEEIYQCISNLENMDTTGSGYQMKWNKEISWWQGDYGYVKTDFGKSGEWISSDGKTIISLQEGVGEGELIYDRFIQYSDDNKYGYKVYDIKTKKTWEGKLISVESEYKNKFFHEKMVQCVNGVIGRVGDTLIQFDTGKKYEINGSAGIVDVYENEKNTLILLDDGEKHILLNQNLDILDKDVYFITDMGNYLKEDGIYDNNGNLIKRCYPRSFYYDYDHYYDYNDYVDNPSFNLPQIIIAALEPDAEYGQDCCFTYFDSSGCQITNKKFCYASVSHSGLAYVYDEEKIGVIDNYGNTMVGLNAENFSSQAAGLPYHTIIVQDNASNYYFYDFSNFIIPEGQIEEVSYKREKESYQNELLKNAESMDDFTLSGMNTKFTVPEEVPVIGGGEMKLDFSMVPIVFEKSGNQFRAGIGIEVENDGENVDSILFHKKDTWGSLKKAVEKQKENYLKGKDLLLKSQKGIASVPMKKSVETKVYGYLEGTLDQGTVKSVEGKLVVDISFSASKKWQTMIVVVPVVFTAKGEAGAKFSLELGLDFSEASVFARGEVEFTLPKIRLSGGVGVAYVADVSVYGSFSNMLKISDGSNEKPSITDTISGEMGASASLFCLTYEKALWEGNKVIYPSKNGKKKRIKSVENTFANEASEEDFVIDRDYAERTSEWVDQKADSGQASTIQILQKDVYTQASPKIVTMDDGTKLMIFTTDIAGRETGNHIAVAYSVYDKISGKWSEPQVADDDGTADFYPEVVTDGADTYLAWADVRGDKMDKNSTAGDFAKKCEITVAKFDSGKEEFVNVTTITDNDYADLRPSLSVQDGRVCVAWLVNMDNDVISLSGKNEIHYVEGQNGKWGTEQTYLSQNKPITRVAVGKLKSKTVIAYTTGSEENGQLYLGELSDEAGKAEMVQGKNEVSDMQFASLSGSDVLSFSTANGLWYTSDGKEFKCLLEGNEQYSESYQIISGERTNMIVCSEATEKGSNIYGYIMQDDEIVSSVPLTSQGDYIRHPNGFYEGGKYYITFTREHVDVSGDSFDVTSDICVMEFGTYTDVAAETATVETDMVTPGENGKINVTVRNMGLEDVSECQIQILDGDDAIGTAITSTVLKPGEETEQPINVNWSEEFKEKTKLTCKITADGDSFTENNSLNLEVGKTNLELEVFSFGQGKNTRANLYITNTSGFNTGGTLKIYDGDSTGKLLRTIEIGEIKASERKQIRLTAEDLASLGEIGDSLYFEVISDKGDEEYETDNYGFIFLAGRHVSQVALSEDELYFTKTGETKQLSCNVYPEDATDKSVTYYSTDTSVAKVSSEGLVTAIGEGEAVITAVSRDNENITDNCYVYVTLKKGESGTNQVVSSGNIGQKPSSTVSQVAGDNKRVSRIKAPGKVKNISVKNKKGKKVFLSWKKVTGAKGYQIQYSTSKRFKKYKSRNTVKKKYTIKKLKKKTYYVRVRAYKKSSGKKIYGKWSKVKKIKIKK